MIDRVVIENFKLFNRVEFDLRGRHVVLAGPNNTGKTTVLQAVAAWGFALAQWRTLNDFNQRNGWVKKPITRQQFMPVSVRSFDMLWRERSYSSEITVTVHEEGRSIGMEFQPDSTEQIYVRPTFLTMRDALESMRLDTVFVPPMSGLSVDEPVYKPAKLEQLLGQSKPGEVLRNLLVTAYDREGVWPRLTAAVRELFQIELDPPNDSGADIIATFRHVGSSVPYDIASGGSGFQQVLMLLTFLNTRQGAVLLLDEPDAHLHVFLQEAIFEQLRRAAAESHSQIIAATHSEVIIDSMELDEIYVLVDTPLRLVDEGQRGVLTKALRVIDNVDLMKIRIAPGILYLEGYTDLEILRAWARTVKHPALAALGPNVYWRKTVSEIADGSAGIRSRDHFDAIQLVRPGFPGLQIVDGDSNVNAPTDAVSGTRPPTAKWRRYEIESYLVHPAAIERFIESQVGAAAFTHDQRAAVRTKMAELLTDAFVNEPMKDHLPTEAVFQQFKARERLLPPLLSEGGLHGFPYTRYHEIAALMLPDEIHPEVIQKLDAIRVTFGIPGRTAPPPPAARPTAFSGEGDAGAAP